MIVSNLLFDVILFGALLAAALLDKNSPHLAGVASVLAVAAATYVAAQEWSDALVKRRIWTQDSLSTAVALSTLGFIYFWWRNDSDFILLILSIGLMMASLMVAIATIAALGSAFKDMKPGPIGGWILTIVVAFSLGILGGVLALFLGGGATLFAKVLVLGISLFGWKIRETLRPPLPNMHAQNAPVTGGEAPSAPIADARAASTRANELDLSLPATHAQRWFPIPQRGTLLDRFVPVLVLGALLFVAARQIKSPDLWSPTSPAAADNGGYLNNDSDTESGETP